MKKTILTLLMVTLLIFIIKLVTPSIVDNGDIYDMDLNEYQNTLNNAKENKADALVRLLNYYNLVHKDEKSACMVLCKITSFRTAQKGYFRLYRDLNCSKKVHCTKKSLDELVFY